MPSPYVLLALLFLVNLIASESTSSRPGRCPNRCVPLEPPLPGILPGFGRPKLILAQDINYPPYAFLSSSISSTSSPSGGLTGFAHDLAIAVGVHCNIDMHVVQTQWDQCWDAGKIGTGLLNGHFHACVSYTHTHGERNRYLEFSRPILRDNKPAGILTRLDNVTGKPVISSMSDLDGVTVVDVRGWAPTGDTLGFVENTCTGKPFKGFKIVQPDESGNDAALRMLLEGKADAMYVYADQAARLECEEGVSADWDCDLWKGFGKTFAYIHTGMFGYAVAGTTLTIAKKGAGVAGILDKCIDRFVKTKWYFHLCKKYDLVDSGFPNQYFPQGAATPRIWDLPSTNHTASCLDGYCGCI